MEAEYPEEPADVMALAFKKVSALYPQETVDAVTGDSEHTMPGPAQQRSTALVVHCGGGGSILAAEEFLEVIAAADANLKALGCVIVDYI